MASSLTTSLLGLLGINTPPRPPLAARSSPVRSQSSQSNNDQYPRRDRRPSTVDNVPFRLNPLHQIHGMLIFMYSVHDMILLDVPNNVVDGEHSSPGSYADIPASTSPSDVRNVPDAHVPPTEHPIAVASIAPVRQYDGMIPSFCFVNLLEFSENVDENVDDSVNATNATIGDVHEDNDHAQTRPVNPPGTVSDVQNVPQAGTVNDGNGILLNEGIIMSATFSYRLFRFHFYYEHYPGAIL